MSTLNVDTWEPESGTAMTLGASDSTITALGSTRVGFGVAWQTVQTTGFTAVAGKGYPCNTTSGAFTVTLPSSASVGDQISLVDYAGTFDTNNLTINPNGLKLKGNTPNQLASTEREGFTITYVDVTQGWVATSGVNTGSSALAPITYDIEWLVVAGGGGGACGIAVSGKRAGGGGGGGGYKNSFASEASGGGASTETKITGIGTGVVLTATVGPGGVGGFGSGDPGDVGVDSSLAGTGIVTITSAGGGLGNTQHASGGAGGSGGGGGANYGGTQPGGAGTANQGYAGGSGATNGGGGGGGSSAVGSNGNGGTGAGGNGGAGLNNTITGASVGRSGGGGGGGSGGGAGSATHGGGAGGSGGGAAGTNGTANTGGGGGGQGDGTDFDAGQGGVGIIILRMLTADYSTTVTGSPTVAVDGSHTVVTFTGTGSYTT